MSNTDRRETSAEKAERIRNEKERQLQIAFREVFGPKEARSDNQKFVLDVLDEWGFVLKPYSSAGAITDGRLRELEGMREIVLSIKSFANSSFEPKKKKEIVVEK